MSYRDCEYTRYHRLQRLKGLSTKYLTVDHEGMMPHVMERATENPDILGLHRFIPRRRACSVELVEHAPRHGYVHRD